MCVSSVLFHSVGPSATIGVSVNVLPPVGTASPGSPHSHSNGRVQPAIFRALFGAAFGWKKTLPNEIQQPFLLPPIGTPISHSFIPFISAQFASKFATFLGAKNLVLCFVWLREAYIYFAYFCLLFGFTLTSGAQPMASSVDIHKMPGFWP